MRKTFIEKLISGTDERTFLLVGDLGYSVVEPFAERFPKQFLNAGVAEQNMAGMSAGLALSGGKVFNYSIANFNTLRAIEQIRNDICYNDLDVTVVSVGGGFVYGSAGYSHHAVQDIAMLYALPNMTLLLPADATEVGFCMQYALNKDGPKFLRLGKNGEKEFHDKDSVISSINLISGKPGAKIALLSVGTILSLASDVQSELFKNDIAVDLFSCPLIDKGFTNTLREKMKNYDKIFVFEDHIIGMGFSAIVRQALEWENKQIKSFGAQRDLCKVVGGQEYMRSQHGLGVESVIAEIMQLMNIPRYEK
jgi:transketolase